MRDLAKAIADGMLDKHHSTIHTLIRGNVPNNRDWNTVKELFIVAEEVLNECD